MPPAPGGGSYGRRVSQWSRMYTCDRWLENPTQINGEDIYTIQTRDNANPATPADIDDTYIVHHPTDD